MGKKAASILQKMAKPTDRQSDSNIPIYPQQTSFIWDITNISKPSASPLLPHAVLLLQEQ